MSKNRQRKSTISKPPKIPEMHKNVCKTLKNVETLLKNLQNCRKTDKNTLKMSRNHQKN